MSQPITVAQLDPLSLKNKLIRVILYDLFSSEEKQLRAAIYKITEAFGGRKRAPVVYTMIRELAVNSLKAVYKKIFYERVIEEMGMGDVSYEQWLELFRTEIEAHRAENFARLARENAMGISVFLKFNEERFSIRIINQGQPSELELARIHQAIEKCRGLTTLQTLLEEKSDGDANKEGAGIGIPLCIMTLRGLQIAEENFRIVAHSGRTIAALDLPWENLLPAAESNHQVK